jgi:flavodoxin I
MFRFDHSDPQCLIIYTGTAPLVPDDYREMHRQWIARLEQGQRFGIIVVSEPPAPRADVPDEERDRQNAEEFTRLLNAFRRDYRARTAHLNVGYARVMPEDWIANYFAREPGDWERSLADNDRYTHYNWGIPGGLFTRVDDAKAWIRAQFEREAAQISPEDAPQSHKRVGLYYGSNTGITEAVALRICDVWNASGLEPITPINIAHVKVMSDMLASDYLILGISTWHHGQLQDDWAILIPQLERLDFTGKKIALFGVGDQVNYSDYFLDAMGILAQTLLVCGAELVGAWTDEHYAFRASKAFEEGRFVGLGIDQIHQADLTETRIARWVAQIIQEFALQPTSPS